MLMMRRHEKDFMLRGDEKYGDELTKRVGEFLTELAKADLPDPLVPFEPQPSFGLVPVPNGLTRSSIVLVPNPEPAGADVTVLQRRNDYVAKCMRGRGYAPER